MNKMKTDLDIRSKIIITDHCTKADLRKYSNIELAAKYSKNKKNYNILKLLLKENKNNELINKAFMKTIAYFETTSSLDVAKLLLDNGAEINFSDSFNWTSLMNSCLNFNNLNSYLNKKRIDFLIENGSDVNVKNCDISQPLTILIIYSSDKIGLETIKLLIRKGSNVNFKDKYFVTPLMICFELNNNISIRYDIIKLLLDNKADVYIKNTKGYNIFNLIENIINLYNCEQTDEIFEIYSLIFNYKNLKNDHLCESDINFIYYK